MRLSEGGYGVAAGTALTLEPVRVASGAAT